MKHRILTAVVVAPLLIVLTTTPAYAIFGSILAGIQRAQMIANQGIQIYKDTMAKITFDGQLTQMTEQFAHLKEQALGSVGALTDPFTDLASVPTQFIGVGLSWKNDFTGIAQGVASSVENMGETGKSFRESWSQRLTEADTVTQGNLTAAMAQLMAFQAAKEAAKDYEREIARRRELARWVGSQRRAEINFNAQQTGLDASRDTMREGLLFRIPELYGGPGQ